MINKIGMAIAFLFVRMRISNLLENVFWGEKDYYHAQRTINCAVTPNESQA